MAKSKNLLEKPIIKIFVYGTLLKDQKLGFYMNGSEFLGEYYTQGQLMKSSNDNVYIDTDYYNAVTFGEVYKVNFYCLQRINHLEVLSGTFPQGYDLSVKEVWKCNGNQFPDFEEEKKELAFYYRWKNCSVKILTGNYKDDFEPIAQLEHSIYEASGEKIEDKILEIMKKKLSIYENLGFEGKI